MRAVYTKIDRVATTGGMYAPTWCSYQVPGFVLGYPVFDHEQCVCDVLQNLLDDGFYAVRAEPDSAWLHISWRSDLIEDYVKRTAPKRLAQSILETRRAQQQQHAFENDRSAEQLPAVRTELTDTGTAFGGGASGRTVTRGSGSKDSHQYHPTGKLFYAPS